MKRKEWLILALMCLVSAVLLSLPWLVPGTGAVALVAFVPLLFADAIADQCRLKCFWPLAFLTFTAWNAITTFWVCNATVGGGIFAVVANAAQMTIVWGLFRLSKKRLGGALPYIFLLAAWIAWEREYFFVDISWPWLTLGYALAQTTSLAQWYEYTGSIGGSLWILASNLAIFGMINVFASGIWRHWNNAARSASLLGTIALIFVPMGLSIVRYTHYEEKSEGKVDVVIAQPNFDPYQKFESMSQEKQTAVLLSQYKDALEGQDSSAVLLLAPETFTSDINLDAPALSPTVESIRELLVEHPGTGALVGAATYQFYHTAAAPSILSRGESGSWYETHNSAVTIDTSGVRDIYHKSKLVVGTELTPYPKIFVPLDNWLSKLMGVSGLMARDIGQDEVSVMHFGEVPVGCAICYESVYGEYCTEYVKKGAQMMSVITNDAWWGDTPGYRQHLSYSRLRAIELRRDVARCANTGISCIIDQKGDLVSKTSWWERETLTGEINLNSEETFFVRHGDMAGRTMTLVFLLLALLLVVRFTVRKD